MEEPRDSWDAWLEEKGRGTKIGIALALSVVGLYFAYDTVQLFQKALFWTALMTGTVSGLMAPYGLVMGVCKLIAGEKDLGLKMLSFTACLIAVAWLCVAAFDRMPSMPKFAPTINHSEAEKRG